MQTAMEVPCINATLILSYTKNTSQYLCGMARFLQRGDIEVGRNHEDVL